VFVGVDTFGQFWLIKKTPSVLPVKRGSKKEKQNFHKDLSLFRWFRKHAIRFKFSIAGQSETHSKDKNDIHEN
jgi:hypothetical protein